MSNESKNASAQQQEGNEKPYPWHVPEKRLRFVNLLRIEENRNEHPLTSYEQKVKDKLATVPSPADELIRQEDEEQIAAEERSERAKLALLVKRARLSPKQKACYGLLYVEKVSNEEVAKRLHVKLSRVYELKQQIETQLKKTHQNQIRAKLTKNHPLLSPIQKRISKLRYSRRLSFKEIGQMIGLSKQHVWKLFREAEKNYVEIKKRHAS